MGVPQRVIADDVTDTSAAPFHAFAGRYYDIGFSIIPCGGIDGKKPCVKWKHFQEKRISERLLHQWAKEYADANIAIITGRISNVTVIDVDDPNLFGECVTRFGETPLIIQTPRGGRHYYYTHSGEGCIQRLGGKGIDVRGNGGFVIAPPSWKPHSNHRYSFIDCDLTSFCNLPSVKMAALPDFGHNTSHNEKNPMGKRNTALFLYLKDEVAPFTDSFDELQEKAELYNMSEQITPEEISKVRATARSIWRLKQEDRLMPKGGTPTILLLKSEHELLRPHPLAHVIYSDWKSEHWGVRKEFTVSIEAYAKRIGKSPTTVRNAVQYIEHVMLIKRTRQGGRWKGDAALYSFVPRI